jgi:hypothetical protein
MSFLLIYMKSSSDLRTSNLIPVKTTSACRNKPYTVAFAFAKRTIAGATIQLRSGSLISDELGDLADSNGLTLVTVPRVSNYSDSVDDGRLTAM